MKSKQRIILQWRKVPLKFKTKKMAFTAATYTVQNYFIFRNY